jgi:DNA-binding transcriptional LysR family regulator
MAHNASDAAADAIDIRLLRCFDALMTDRSVSRAARRLNISQPSMSVALARLRKSFADPLLVRGGNEMVPTSRALTLWGTVRGVLDGIDNLGAGAAPFDPRTSRMQFTLTAPAYIGYVLLPRLMRELEKTAPYVRVEVRAANRERATEWLARGEVDFRLGWIRDPPPGLRFKTLPRERLVCLARRNHPALAGRLTTEHFCTLRHIRTMVDRASESGQVIDQLLEETTGKRLRIVLLAQEALMVPYVVATSDHIAVLPERLARAFAAHLPIKVHPIPLQLPNQEIGLYWHERTHRDPAHAWFRGLLAKIRCTP